MPFHVDMSLSMGINQSAYEEKKNEWPALVPTSPPRGSNCETHLLGGDKKKQLQVESSPILCPYLDFAQQGSNQHSKLVLLSKRRYPRQLPLRSVRVVSIIYANDYQVL